MAVDTAEQPTVALLGSTGNTGREVLRTFLARGTHNLRIYVRSTSKLESLFPNIALNPKVSIYSGPAKDHSVMKSCLEGADLIICTLGSNEYTRTTILQDSARSIIEALRELSQTSAIWHKPRMVYLSSSSQNPRFAGARPTVVNWLIKTAFQMGYADLTIAENLLLTETSLVSVLRVQPGVLVEEKGSGLAIDAEEVKLACSYEDLGRACVVLALERSYDPLTEIGVSSEGGNRFLRYAPTILSRISSGIFTVYLTKLAWSWGRLWGRS